MNFIAAAASHIRSKATNIGNTKKRPRAKGSRFPGPSTAAPAAVVVLSEDGLEGVPEHGDAMQFPPTLSQVSSETDINEELREEIEDILEERGLYPGSFDFISAGFYMN